MFKSIGIHGKVLSLGTLNFSTHCSIVISKVKVLKKICQTPWTSLRSQGLNVGTHGKARNTHVWRLYIALTVPKLLARLQFQTVNITDRTSICLSVTFTFSYSSKELLYQFLWGAVLIYFLPYSNRWNQPFEIELVISYIE